MKDKKEIKIGDVVKTKVKRYSGAVPIEIMGTVREIKSSYGRKEYHLTNTRTDDFWVRTAIKIG